MAQAGLDRVAAPECWEPRHTPPCLAIVSLVNSLEQHFSAFPVLASFNAGPGAAATADHEAMSIAAS